MDLEQVYQEVLQEEQKKGSSAPVAEGRAKAARQRAVHGSPHPKEPKWWPGSQPQFEGGGGEAEPAEEAAPAEEPAPTEEPAEEMPAAEAAEPAPVSATAAAPDQNAPVEVDQQAAGAPPPVPVDQPPASQPAQQPAAAAAVAQAPATPATTPPEQRPAGVSHGTTSGTRLRPEDETATEAQFTGQQAMYQRRKLIDDLLATGVPQVAADDTGRSRSPMLALLYILIPLLAIGYLAGADGGATGAEADHGPGENGGGAITVVAQGIAFDTNEITLPAGEPATIEFDNQDSAPHNIAIYESQEDGQAFKDPIFDGQEITATQTTYEFEAPPKGEYYFQCDVHPSMNGTVVAE